MRSPSPLDRFVSALHRRLLVVRALETTALGAAGGCVVGAMMIPLLMWRGVPALTPTLWALALGSATGLLGSLTRRPTQLDAAAEADRQLELSDLLATALTVRLKARESDRDADAEPWLRTVLSIADATCRNRTPSQVILHRLHARAWGGIALAAAGVVSLAALTAPEPTARAAGAGAPRVSARGLPQETAHDAARTTAGGPERIAPSRSPGTGPEREGQRATSRAVNETENGPEPSGTASAGNTVSTSDNGLGGGSARARTPPPRDTTFTSPQATPAGPPSTTGGESAPGAAGPTGTPPAARGGDAPGTSGGGSPDMPPAPPWHAPGWADDARRAREAVDSGRVPDAHRDLVREYFDRDRR